MMPLMMNMARNQSNLQIDTPLINLLDPVDQSSLLLGLWGGYPHEILTKVMMLIFGDDDYCDYFYTDHGGGEPLWMLMLILMMIRMVHGGYPLHRILAPRSSDQSTISFKKKSVKIVILHEKTYF